MLIYSKSDNIKKYEEENKNHLEAYSLSVNTCPDLSSPSRSSFRPHLRNRGRRLKVRGSLTQQSGIPVLLLQSWHIPVGLIYIP